MASSPTRLCPTATTYTHGHYARRTLSPIYTASGRSVDVASPRRNSSPTRMGRNEASCNVEPSATYTPSSLGSQQVSETVLIPLLGWLGVGFNSLYR